MSCLSVEESLEVQNVKKENQKTKKQKRIKKACGEENKNFGFFPATGYSFCAYNLAGCLRFAHTRCLKNIHQIFEAICQHQTLT
jgi:hypothetical protein